MGGIYKVQVRMLNRVVVRKFVPPVPADRGCCLHKAHAVAT